MARSPQATPEQPPWWRTPVGSAANVVLRLIFLPAFIAHEVINLPSRLVWREPDSYNPRGLRPKLCKSGGQTHYAETYHAHNLLIGSRMEACAKQSWMLAWEAFLYFALLDGVALLGLNHLFIAHKQNIERFLSGLTGSWQVLEDGTQGVTSLANLAAPSHDLPYKPLELGSDATDVQTLRGRHFMAACCELAYEPSPVMEDTVSRWGLRWEGTSHTSGRLCQEGYAADCTWLCCSMPGQVLLAFRGADPLTQIDRRADIPTACMKVKGMGSVNCAFLRSLQQPDACSPGKTVFSRLEACLEAACTHASDGSSSPRIVVAGHSLGGGIASVLAQLLFARQAPVSRYLHAVAVFGAPRPGDREFARLLESRLPGGCLRCLHGADMVCSLPNDPEYAAPGVLLFIRSAALGLSPTARLVQEGKGGSAVQRLVSMEERWAYAYSMRKLIASPFRETKTRFVLRLLMAPLPGLGDHLLCDYEQALRHALLQELAAKPPDSTRLSVGEKKRLDQAQDVIRVQVAAA